ATRVFPFALPQNLSLTSLRATLKAGASPLADIYGDFQVQTGGSAAMPNAITAATETLGLSAEQRAVVTHPSQDLATLGQYFGLPSGSTAPSPVQMPVSLGQVSATGTTVTGTGFPASVNGWVISVGGALRVITAVTATQISVDCAWPQAMSNVPATAYAPQSVSQLAVFSATTGLDTPQVVRLLKQDLAPEEVAAALAHNFFINRTNPGTTIISLVTDMSDANYSLDILSNLTLANVDAINRFLRLATASGWSYADLDWALKSGGFTEITDAALVHLAAVDSLRKRLALPVDEMCGLFADLKTYGRGSGATPVDLYDRVFNATAGSVGRTPYRPVYAGNPLFNSAPIVWSVGSAEATDRATQTWLAGALQLTEADLLLVAKRISSTQSLTLDVPTLSKFYAYARLARALKMKVPALLQAMDLLGITQLGSLDAVRQVVTFKDWLDPSGLTLADAAYVTTGVFDRKVTGALDPAAVPPFLTSLRALARPWLLNAASFEFDDIDAPRSVEIFKALVVAQVLDITGVVLADGTPAFPDLAPFFPVTAGTLLSDVVSATDAAAAIALLQQHKVLDGTTLGAAVTTATDLSFLFPGDKDRQTKIDSVQNDLITVSTDCSHSCDVVGNGLNEQRLGAYTQLALLIEDSVAMASALGEFSLLPSGNPLQLLLTPAGTDDIMVPAITVADRLAFAASRLNLDADAMRLACILESDYGFRNLNEPDTDDLRLLALYSQLLKAFDNDSNDMAGYMTAPEQPLNIKMDALKLLTGWSAGQSTALVQALWGGSGFNGLDNLATMRRCFNRAQVLGAEITSVLGIAATAGLERLPLPTLSGGTQNSWVQWTIADQAAGDMLKARYGAASWPEIYKPIHDAVAESRRQALVGLAVLLLSPTIPAIKSARTLSEYLLIDVEAGTCNVTTPILETTAAAQMYVQRCRMALEEGVTSVSISDLTWSWMGNYRMWEANRKVFIYPENYLNPSLRRQRTPLFSAFMDQLQQDEITDATVTNAFTQYMTSFAELATIQPVDAVNCKAPNTDTGELVDQTILVGRSAEEPYAYYWRTLEDSTIWSPWYSIDAKIPVPVVTLFHAFGRLFLFWVETEETNGSTISGGSQIFNSGCKASIKYIFQRLDESWTAPQALVEGLVIQYQPADYTTKLINTAPNAGSLAGIDPSQPYWHRPYVVLQPGQSGASDQLAVGLGNAYQTIADKPGQPPGNGPASLQRLDQSIYNAGLLSAAATAQQAQSQKVAGSVMMLPVAVLDDTLTATQAWALLQNADVSDPGGPRPFGGLVHQDTMVLIPSANVLVDNMLSEAPDYYSRVTDGSPWSTLLYNLSPSAEVVPVKNQPGWWIFNNGDEAFLAVT
ncbi:MAG TPA: neuraminidase-like domain-containing protein, partial [Magnetospirillum sp.]|nr:neuraminidase-like domain-containing protein [Magnetospirillum sp.]